MTDQGALLVAPASMCWVCAVPTHPPQALGQTESAAGAPARPAAQAAAAGTAAAPAPAPASLHCKKTFCSRIAWAGRRVGGPCPGGAPPRGQRWRGRLLPTAAAAGGTVAVTPLAARMLAAVSWAAADDDDALPAAHAASLHQQRQHGDVRKATLSFRCTKPGPQRRFEPAPTCLLHAKRVGWQAGHRLLSSRWRRRAQPWSGQWWRQSAAGLVAREGPRQRLRMDHGHEGRHEGGRKRTGMGGR